MFFQFTCIIRTPAIVPLLLVKIVRIIFEFLRYSLTHMQAFVGFCCDCCCCYVMLFQFSSDERHQLMKFRQMIYPEHCHGVRYAHKAVCTCGFYLNGAMLHLDTCYRKSVSLSVTFVHPTRSAKFLAVFLCHFVPQPSADLHAKCLWRSSQGTPPSAKLNSRQVEKYTVSVKNAPPEHV